MENWQFWLVAAAITAAVGATLVRALTRAGTDLRAAAEFDIRVYRDQLAEIDRDLARGTLAADEGARLKAEVSRRLLDADRALQAGSAPVGRGGLGVAMALVVVAVAGALWAYTQLGVPGYPDLPLAARMEMSKELLAARPNQADAEAAAPKAESPPVDADFAGLMDKLRAAVAERPDDQRGLELLASNEARLGNLVAAHKAMAQLVAVKGDAATAEDHAALAELMVMAAGGTVSPEAEAELKTALQMDPNNGTARYYSGVLMAQVGRYDLTFRLWAPLLENGPPDAPWVDPIRSQIEDIAWRAGEKYTLPPTGPGPDAAAVAAAGDMTPEERQAMIEGMVGRLDDRLKTEGGTPEEWARLLNALVQLGRTEDAQAAFDRARKALEGDAVGLSGVTETAVSLGLSQ